MEDRYKFGAQKCFMRGLRVHDYDKLLSNNLRLDSSVFDKLFKNAEPVITALTRVCRSVDKHGRLVCHQSHNRFHWTILIIVA
jgi:hypothetical protein